VKLAAHHRRIALDDRRQQPVCQHTSRRLALDGDVGRGGDEICVPAHREVSL
jgi:hypothetical protein